MTLAELRALIADCVALWEVDARVSVYQDGIAVETDAGRWTVAAAPVELNPVRWLLQTPERRQANRPPRAAPSIVALLSALRVALGGGGGNRLRIAAEGTAP